MSGLTQHTFGLSTAPSFGPSAIVLRRKADADAMQARHDALPETVTTWSGVLTFAEQEALAAVWRFYTAHGENPVPIPRADLAAHLNVTPEEAERLLNKLAAAGAVRRDLRFHSAPRYVPIPVPPEPKRNLKTDDGKRADPSALPRLRSALGARSR